MREERSHSRKRKEGNWQLTADPQHCYEQKSSGPPGITSKPSSLVAPTARSSEVSNREISIVKRLSPKCHQIVSSKFDIRHHSAIRDFEELQLEAFCRSYYGCVDSLLF